MILKLVICVAFFVCVVQTDRLPGEAPWVPCPGVTNMPNGASNVHVYVTSCNSTDVHCRLPKGTVQTISTTFTTNTSSPRLERTIIAQFLRKIRGRFVEVPYGGIVDACNHTKRLGDGLTCHTGGLLANTTYNHSSSFPVFANSPKITLNVRYILRAPSQESARVRRTQTWSEHPGPYFVCAEIPVEIIA